MRTHTPRHLIVRTNLYGWSLGPRLSLAEWLLRGMLQNDTIKTFNDVRFNPLFTKDLALILFDAIDQRPIGTFHLGSRDTCSKHEFALLISQIFHIPAHLTPISVEEFPFKAPRPKNTTLSVEKISGFLKHQMPEVADGIRAFRAFLGQGEVSLENKEWLAKLPMEHR